MLPLIFRQIFTGKVNPSTPQPEDRGFLRVDPERRFSTLPSKVGLDAAERVKRNRDTK
jgi:hypothetical protein